MRNRATLIDGRQVSTWSEAWRHECEARYVANLPTRQARREYLDKVAARRGTEAGQRLEQLATTIYTTQRAKTAPQPNVSEPTP